MGAAIAAAGLALAACGAEGTMSAREFVASIERQGVEVELGRELITDDPRRELYALELTPLEVRADSRPSARPHSAGSIGVYEDAEGADRGLGSCEAAVDLLCYRAANVVVVLEGGGIEARRLAVAMQALKD